MARQGEVASGGTNRGRRVPQAAGQIFFILEEARLEETHLGVCRYLEFFYNPIRIAHIGRHRMHLAAVPCAIDDYQGYPFPDNYSVTEYLPNNEPHKEPNYKGVC